MALEESILTSTKKALQLPEDYTAFDQDIMMHINAALATLNQLGVGPADGVVVSDTTAEWSDLIEDNAKLNHVQTYVYLVVRSMFDPPATGFAVTALEKQIKEYEWRISATREEEIV